MEVLQFIIKNIFEIIHEAEVNFNWTKNGALVKKLWRLYGFKMGALKIQDGGVIDSRWRVINPRWRRNKSKMAALSAYYKALLVSVTNSARVCMGARMYD